MCRHCGNDTCHGGCWSSFISCLKCLCYCCCDSDDGGALPLISRSDSMGSSEDLTVSKVTTLCWTLPGQEGSGDNTYHAYNCWLWALNPVTKKFDSKDIIKGKFNNINDLANSAKTILESNGATCEILNENDAKTEWNNYDPNGVIYYIAMRMSQKKDGDYHFVRLLYGQWSAKSGFQGPIIAQTQTTTPPGPPTEGLWMYHSSCGKHPGPTHLEHPRESNGSGGYGKVTPMIQYKEPTLYIKVTLPQQRR